MGLFIFVSSTVQKLEPKNSIFYGLPKTGKCKKLKIQKIQKSTSPNVQRSLQSMHIFATLIN
jgi:hypothetical protein